MEKQPSVKKLLAKRKDKQDRLLMLNQKLDTLTAKKKSCMKDLRELDSQLADLQRQGIAPPKQRGEENRASA